MAKSTALLSTLLLVALAGATSAESLRAPNDVNDACNHVIVPQLCTSIITKSAPATVRDLTLASIKEAIAAAENARTVAEHVRSEETAAEAHKSGLDVCSDVFGQATEALQRASSGMDAYDEYRAAVKELSAVLMLITDCSDAFSDNSGVVSAVFEATGALKKLVGNSLLLSMMMHLQAKQDSLKAES